MNANIFKETYKSLVYNNKEKFLEDLKEIEKLIDFKTFGQEPILILGDLKVNPLYFLIGYHYSKNDNRVLGFSRINGIAWQKLSFPDENDYDQDLRDKVLYGDITFFNLTGDIKKFQQELIINAIDTRYSLSKRTVIYLDTAIANIFSIGLILDFFKKREFTILNLSGVDISIINQKGISYSSSKTKSNTNKKNTTKSKTNYKKEGSK